MAAHTMAMVAHINLCRFDNVEISEGTMGHNNNNSLRHMLCSSSSGSQGTGE